MQASDDHRTWCGVQERLSCRCIAKERGADINYPRSYACVSAHSSVKLVVCAGRCTCRSRSIGLLWGSGFSGGLWAVLDVPMVHLLAGAQPVMSLWPLRIRRGPSTEMARRPLRAVATERFDRSIGWSGSAQALDDRLDLHERRGGQISRTTRKSLD